MKRALLFILLLSPLFVNGQVTIFTNAGIATNTLGNKWGKDASMVISPSFEVGILDKVTKKVKIGLLARYGSFNVNSRYVRTTNGGSIYEDKRKSAIEKDMFTGLGMIGVSYSVGRVDIEPSVEGGLSFKNSPRFVIGIRTDAIINLTKSFGIMGGISADHYSLKDYPGWYFAGKVGVAIKLLNNKAIKS